tara:strand:+ start:1726 stop:3651 length:1926 start_codon:yes stop_codon:yes gene_type:complete
MEKTLTSIPTIILNKFNLFFNGGAGCGKTITTLKTCYNLDKNNKILYLNSSRAAMLFAKEKFIYTYMNQSCPDVKFFTVHGWISKCLKKLVTSDIDLSSQNMNNISIAWLPNIIVLDDFHLYTELQTNMIRKIINFAEYRAQFILLGDFDSINFDETNWAESSSSRGWIQIYSRHSMRCSSAICNFINANTERELYPIQPTLHNNCEILSIDITDLQSIFERVKKFLSHECAILFPSEFKTIRRACMNFINVAIKNTNLKFHTRNIGEVTFNYESLQKKLLVWSVSQFEGIEKKIVILFAPPNVSSQTLYKAASRAKIKFIWIRHTSNLGKLSKTFMISYASDIFRTQNQEWKTIVEPEIRDDICMVARFDTHSEDLSFIYGNAIMFCLEYFFTSKFNSLKSFTHPIFINNPTEAKEFLQKYRIESNLESNASIEQTVAHTRYALSHYKFHEIESRVYSTKYFFNRISQNYHSKALQLLNQLDTDKEDCIQKIFQFSLYVTAFNEHQGILKQLESDDWLRIDSIHKSIFAVSNILCEFFSCDLSIATFEKSLSYGMLCGKCDIYFEGLVCEVKFTSSLIESHKIQTLIYACIATIQTQQPHIALLINVRNLEVIHYTVQIDFAYELLGNLMSILTKRENYT